MDWTARCDWTWTSRTGRLGQSLLGKEPGGWMARSPQLWTGRLVTGREERWKKSGGWMARSPQKTSGNPRARGRQEIRNDDILFIFVKYITRISTFRIVSDSILVKFYILCMTFSYIVHVSIKDITKLLYYVILILDMLLPMC